MMQQKASGLIMTNWIPMSYNNDQPALPSRASKPAHFHIFAIALFAAAVPLWSQAPQVSLANLIQQGNHKAALAQIRAGADVNAPQPDGTRPIHWAVYKVDYELFDLLIAKKAKVEVTNEFGSTPLAEAAKLGDARMVRTL